MRQKGRLPRAATPYDDLLSTEAARLAAHLRPPRLSTGLRRLYGSFMDFLRLSVDRRARAGR